MRGFWPYSLWVRQTVFWVKSLMNNAKYKINWADLALSVLLLTFTLWYMYDNWTASSSIENNLLVLPIGIISTLLLIAIVANVLMAGKSTDTTQSTKTSSAKDYQLIMIAMAVFAAYVLSLEWLGFDLATALFLAIFLWVQGERRITLLVFYAAVFAFLVSLFFEILLPYPMPMFIGKETLGLI